MLCTCNSLEPRPSLPRFYLAALEKNWLRDKIWARKAWVRGHTCNSSAYAHIIILCMYICLRAVDHVAGACDFEWAEPIRSHEWHVNSTLISCQSSLGMRPRLGSVSPMHRLPPVIVFSPVSSNMCALRTYNQYDHALLGKESPYITGQ